MRSFAESGAAPSGADKEAPLSAILEQVYVTIPEAADLLHVSPSTIRRWIARGDLAAYRFGHHRVRIKKEDLTAMVAPVSHEAEEQEWEVTLPGDEPLVVRPLTEEEQQKALAIVAELQRLRAEMLARRRGVPFPDSWELINEERERRSRQLSGEDK